MLKTILFIFSLIVEQGCLQPFNTTHLSPKQSRSDCINISSDVRDSCTGHVSPVPAGPYFNYPQALCVTFDESVERLCSLKNVTLKLEESSLRVKNVSAICNKMKTAVEMLSNSQVPARREWITALKGQLREKLLEENCKSACFQNGEVINPICSSLLQIIAYWNVKFSSEHNTPEAANVAINTEKDVQVASVVHNVMLPEPVIPEIQKDAKTSARKESVDDHHPKSLKITEKPQQESGINESPVTKGEGDNTAKTLNQASAQVQQEETKQSIQKTVHTAINTVHVIEKNTNSQETNNKQGTNKTSDSKTLESETNAGASHVGEKHEPVLNKSFHTKENNEDPKTIDKSETAKAMSKASTKLEAGNEEKTKMDNLPMSKDGINNTPLSENTGEGSEGENTDLVNENSPEFSKTDLDKPIITDSSTKKESLPKTEDVIEPAQAQSPDVGAEITDKEQSTFDGNTFNDENEQNIAENHGTFDMDGPNNLAVDDDDEDMPPKIKPLPEIDEDMMSSPQKGPYVNDKFVNAEDSHFFAYFMTMIIICIVGYLVYHNKQKILALALEGRSRRSSRRRPNTSGYRKLDSNLEEAVTSACSTSVTHVIY